MKEQHFIQINNPDGKGKRILIIASDAFLFDREDRQKDSEYVITIKDFVNTVAPDSCFCIIPARMWEENYKQPEQILHLYEDAQKFRPDIIIFQLGDHIDEVLYSNKEMVDSFEKLYRYIDPFHKANCAMLSSFRLAVCDYILENHGRESGMRCMNLSELIRDENYYGVDQNNERYPNNEGLIWTAKATLCILEKAIRM